jgi:hypothetical protein
VGLCDRWVKAAVRSAMGRRPSQRGRMVLSAVECLRAWVLSSNPNNQKSLNWLPTAWLQLSLRHSIWHMQHLCSSATNVMYSCCLLGQSSARKQHFAFEAITLLHQEYGLCDVSWRRQAGRSASRCGGNRCPACDQYKMMIAALCLGQGGPSL